MQEPFNSSYLQPIMIMHIFSQAGHIVQGAELVKKTAAQSNSRVFAASSGSKLGNFASKVFVSVRPGSGGTHRGCIGQLTKHVELRFDAEKLKIHRSSLRAQAYIAHGKFGPFRCKCILVEDLGAELLVASIEILGCCQEGLLELVARIHEALAKKHREGHKGPGFSCLRPEFCKRFPLRLQHAGFELAESTCYLIGLVVGPHLPVQIPASFSKTVAWHVLVADIFQGAANKVQSYAQVRDMQPIKLNN